jgi:lipid II:glycine glycyltransferase (peptidoglycan interpeptide bridge formation enzyme)
MTFADLNKTVVTFPDRYLLFGIMKEGEIIAATISIQINQNCLYNFFANHDRKYNSLSPLILLIEGIYAYCQENRIGLFDLGTSALQGKPNFNLLDFKMHIGGVPSAKLTFNKTIA